MSKYSIKEIFYDNWSSFLNTSPNIRSVVNEEVNKMLSCCYMSKSFAVYGCEHCGSFKVVPFMANSRIINYDDHNVTYFYERHEDVKRVIVSLLKSMLTYLYMKMV